MKRPTSTAEKTLTADLAAAREAARKLYTFGGPQTQEYITAAEAVNAQIIAAGLNIYAIGLSTR